jgi:hypothetical protein
LLEVVINGVWLVPTIYELWQNHSKPQDYVGAAGNICFDLGGMASVFMSLPDPNDKLYGTAAYIGLNLVYTGCCIGMAEVLAHG